MKLKINNFCSISRNADWHEFLGRVAPDVLDDLIKFLRTSKSCRLAKTKMIDIYKVLYSQNLGDQFEDFIRRRFPYIIEGEEKPRRPPKPRPKEKKIIPPQQLNRHGVFKSYNPRLLTFPQKLILADDNPEDLMAQVKNFLRDKVSPDYIILENTAYIEYLLPKYKDVADQIPLDAREIESFRRKNR